MEHYELSDIGKHREVNQDAFKAELSGKRPVFVLCDGMGGHKAGEIASAEAAADTAGVLRELLEEDDGDVFIKIVSAVRHANSKVYRMACENEAYNGMGTTCDVCVINDDGACIGHVGDSRIYIYTGGGLYQITKDHSLVEEMVESGRLTRDEARSHSQKNFITRALGTQEFLQVDTYLAAFKQGDIILMCSDGLTNMVAEIDIAYILSSKMCLADMAKRLIELANDNGGSDNITVVLIRR